MSCYCACCLVVIQENEQNRLLRLATDLIVIFLLFSLASPFSSPIGILTIRQPDHGQPDHSIMLMIVFLKPKLLLDSKMIVSGGTDVSMLVCGF